MVFVVLLSKHQKKLFTTFHPQTNGQIERQNSIIEADLKAFINWDKDNWTKFLPMGEFAYNNAKNASTSYSMFKLNCNYHLKISFKEDVHLHSKSCSANDLARELKKLIKVCCQNFLYAQELQKKPIIKELKVVAMLQARKSGWIIKISKQSGTRSSRASFLDFFKSSMQ